MSHSQAYRRSFATIIYTGRTFIYNDCSHSQLRDHVRHIGATSSSPCFWHTPLTVWFALLYSNNDLCKFTLALHWPMYVAFFKIHCLTEHYNHCTPSFDRMPVLGEENMMDNYSILLKQGTSVGILNYGDFCLLKIYTTLLIICQTCRTFQDLHLGSCGELVLLIRMLLHVMSTAFLALLDIWWRII